MAARQRLGHRDLVVVDCRFALGTPGAGRRAWEEGHIPGAHFLDVDEDLSAPPGRGPSPAARSPVTSPRRPRAPGSAPTARSWPTTRRGEGGAARLWWLLRHFGHADVGRARRRPARRGARPAATSTTSPPRPWPSGAPFVPRARRGRHRGRGRARAPARRRLAGARRRPRAPRASVARWSRSTRWRATSRARAASPFVVARARRAVTGRRRSCGRRLGAGARAGSSWPTADRGSPRRRWCSPPRLAGLEARLYPGSWSEWCARGLPVAPGG